MVYGIEVAKREVDPATGHITFFVRVVNEDESGGQREEGPLMPVGISPEALQGQFGGVEEEHVRAFLLSMKDALVEEYRRKRDSSRSSGQVVGQTL